MYYYIFEPATDPKANEQMAQIKELLSSLGIAGEMTTPGPGKSVEDLILQAVIKRYSTIIAVGKTPLINHVAQAIEPHDVVFGIIPTVSHPDITNLIGVDDFKSAAEQLKRRRFHTIQMGVLSNQSYFLTPCHLDYGLDEEYEIDFPKFKLKGKGGKIKIYPSHNSTELCLEIEDAQPVKKVGFWQNIFGGEKKDVNHSLLKAEHFKINSAPKDVMVAESVLASTPISCTLTQKPLKLIIGKGIV